MPTLNWIGKAAVVKHHKDVPTCLLEPVPELSCGEADNGNLIVQGDKLHTLVPVELRRNEAHQKNGSNRKQPWGA